MSFILDALRKSETERSRDALPNLSRIPIAVPRRAVPVWVWALIGLLGVAVVVLGGAWWQSLNAPALVTVRNSPPPGVDIPLPRLEQDVPSRAAPVEEVSPEPVPTRPVPAEASDEPTPQPIDAAEPSVATPLSSIADLMAAGITVPSTVLELHSFSTNPSERFVFINGARYIEGQRTAEGPRVVEIRREGAILSYEGRNFLLLPQ